MSSRGSRGRNRPALPPGLRNLDHPNEEIAKLRATKALARNTCGGCGCICLRAEMKPLAQAVSKRLMLCPPCWEKMTARIAGIAAAPSRDVYLRRVYGIDTEDFGEMLISQDGLCGICRRAVKNYVVDHDHATGEVRGVLCPLCNSGLGMFADDPSRLAAAIIYLTAPNRRQQLLLLKGEAEA